MENIFFGYRIIGFILPWPIVLSQNFNFTINFIWIYSVFSWVWMGVISWIICKLLLFYGDHSFYFISFFTEFGQKHIDDFLITGIKNFFILLSGNEYKMIIFLIISSRLFQYFSSWANRRFLNHEFFVFPSEFFYVFNVFFPWCFITMWNTEKHSCRRQYSIDLT